MNSSPEDALCTRWNTLTGEIRSLEVVLNGLILAGVMDRDTNHIADIQEEVDRKDQGSPGSPLAKRETR